MGEEQETTVSTLEGNRVDNNSTERILTIRGAPSLLPVKKGGKKRNSMTLFQGSISIGNSFIRVGIS